MRLARINPAWRYQPGAFVVLAVVESAERGGIGLRYSGAIGVALDDAEFDARSAGAIGVIGGAEQLEAELRDLLGGRDFERPNDVVVLFAQTQRGGIDGLRQGDHRIARFERGVAIGGQRFARGGVLQLAGLHHSLRRLRGRGAGQDRLERQRLLTRAGLFGILELAGLRHSFRGLLGSDLGRHRPETHVLLAQAGQFGEVLREHHGFDGFVDRVAGIVEWFVAHDLARHAEEARSGSGRAFQNLVRFVERLPFAVGVGDFVPHLAGFGAEFGVAFDGAADLGFERGLARDHAVVAQADQFAGVRFVLGEQAAEGGLRGAQIVLTGGGKGVQLHDAGLQAREAQRQRGVAQKGELRGSGEAARRAGIPAEKDQVALLHALRAPLQVLRSGGRLAVFVGAQERDVEAVAQIGNAVALASEESDGVLRSKDQAQVGVAAVLVKIVAPAGKQADHGANVA